MSFTATPTSANIDVQGMHCGSCVALIEETLGERPGIGSVKVDLEAAKAAVSFDPGTVTIDDICSVISELGYAATPAGD